MQTIFDDIEPSTVTTPPAVRTATSNAKVTEAYDAWWRFACERQHIYYRRLRGEPAPWTEDDTLASYRFTNAYRAADRVSQYLIRHVIYGEDLPPDPNEVVFRVLLFKLFNRIETWEVLAGELGPVVLAENPFVRIEELLTNELKSGRRIYSAAYIMPTSRAPSRKGRKHHAHLALLQGMMADRLGDRLAEAKTMQAGFDLLRSYPMIGDFLAYQFVTDINYSDIVDYSETEFVAAGPGAREGLRKCFADTGGRTDSDLIRMMMDKQEEEFERLGLDFHDLFGRRLQLIDCQNIFCEVAKYARVEFPQLTPPGGRARIKQKYQYAGSIGAPFFPPKWGINDVATARFPLAGADRDADLGGYQMRASRTSFHDRIEGGDAITTPMLGLIGETGEVVSELKKHAREGAAYLAFPNRLGEELGDLLWYVADVSRRRGIRLADIDQATTPEDVACAGDPGGWIRTALSLVKHTGRISQAYEGLLSGQFSDRKFDSVLHKSLVALMTDLKVLVRLHGLSLADIADGNLHKVGDRWRSRVGRLIQSDDMWPENEQLPQCFDAWLSDQGGRVRISFTVGGERIPVAPDSLTDNAYDADGYRFHDVFHLAYAAVLGWSPVTRSLLQRKRKSNPRVDEVEDGGRAVAIEEGISAMVFAHAGQHRMFEGVKTVEDSLLRTIRDMTQHLEVGARTSAEWQDAIIRGFDAWRCVRDAGGGRVWVDRVERLISFAGDKESGSDEALRLP